MNGIMENELRPETMATYWYNRYCTLVTESVPPTAEKAYLVEKLKEAEERIKDLKKEISILNNIIDNFKYKTL
jgi:bacterioferritin (cytochrome b1)